MKDVPNAYTLMADWPDWMREVEERLEVLEQKLKVLEETSTDDNSGFEVFNAPDYE